MGTNCVLKNCLRLVRAQELLHTASSESDLLETFELHPGCSSHQPAILLAEDNLPWIENPLWPSSEQAFTLEISLKEKDLRHGAKEDRPEQMASVAAAGKRAKVEVRLKGLLAHDRELFAEAKPKELNCWVSTSAIQKILRTKLNPEQILKSRWVLTWKAPDNPSDPKKANARLVVLGYQGSQANRSRPRFSDFKPPG